MIATLLFSLCHSLDKQAQRKKRKGWKEDRLSLCLTARANFDIGLLRSTPPQANERKRKKKTLSLSLSFILIKVGQSLMPVTFYTQHTHFHRCGNSFHLTCSFFPFIFFFFLFSRFVFYPQDKSTEQPWMMKSSLFKRLRFFFSPIFLEAFILTFLAEWGDRSQIATVTLASHKNPLGVIIGGVVGHSICTGGAVIGGQLLAAKISQRTVAFVGGAVFILFAMHNIIFGVDHDE